MHSQNRFGKTTSLSELLDKSIFAKRKFNFGMTKVVKHSTIFSFWNEVVGAKFANYTKPTALKGTKLYVSAKSPVIVQELTFCKPKILAKINSYSAPVGVEITDIILSYKNYSASSNPIKNTDIKDIPLTIDKEKLNSSEVDDALQKQIEQNVEKIRFLNDMQKNMLVSKIISTFKVKKFQDK